MANELPMAMARKRPIVSEIQPPKIWSTIGTSEATVETSPTWPTLAPKSMRYSDNML